ncbi:MAG: small heat shock protein [Candidatus Thiodiazotropha sp.]
MRRIIRFSCVVAAALLAAQVQAQPPADYPGAAPYSARPYMDRGVGFSQRQGIRFARDQDETGYHLRIDTQGYTPDAIEVRIEGPYLVVQNQQSQRLENRSERGYSVTSHASSFKRRFRIPRNADVAAMSREESEDRLVITLPYRR